MSRGLGGVRGCRRRCRRARLGRGGVIELLLLAEQRVDDLLRRSSLTATATPPATARNSSLRNRPPLRLRFLGPSRSASLASLSALAASLTLLWNFLSSSTVFGALLPFCKRANAWRAESTDPHVVAQFLVGDHALHVRSSCCGTRPGGLLLRCHRLPSSPVACGAEAILYPPQGHDRAEVLKGGVLSCGDRRLSALAASLPTAALFAAPAHAETECAAPAAGCDHDFPTFAAALGAAASHPGADTVQLGVAKLLRGPVLLPRRCGGVTILGVGRGQTRVAAGDRRRLHRRADRRRAR